MDARSLGNLVSIEQGRPRTPGPQVRLVSTEELQRGDMDTQGDLVEPGRFLIFAWKTNGDEEGTRVEASTPSEAGRKFAELLRSGHVQFTASKIDSDGRVAYP